MREIDVQVAEKVMGKVVCEQSMLWAVGPGFGTGFWTECVVHGENGCVRDPAPYSTDIAAAWQVVERLAAMDRCPDISFGPTDDGEDLWCVMLANPADVEVFADTAPLAICLAALKAVGE